jgi:hypothetical protein
VPPEAEAAVVGATVERRNMTCAVAVAAVAAAVVRVKGALGFVGGKRMAGSVGVEPRDTVGAC